MGIRRTRYRTRTKDLEPAYRSLAFRDQMLPRFLAAAAAASPYLTPSANVDAEIAARARQTTSPPELDLPDPAAPIPNTPDAHATALADAFLRHNPPPKTTLRVIDGGVGDNQS